MLDTEDKSIVNDEISVGTILFDNGYAFYKFIEALSTIQSTVLFNFDPCGKVFNIPIMDDSRICLIDVRIEGDDHIEIFGSITGKKLVVNLEDLKVLLRLKKDTKKFVKLRFGDSKKLFIEKYVGNLYGMVKKSLVYLDVDVEELALGSLATIEYPNTVSISTKLLSDMFYESGNYSEICEIETSEDGIYFRESGVMGEFEAYYKCDDLVECECDYPQKSSHTYTYLNLIKKFLPIMGKTDYVRFSQKTDHPLKIEIRIDSIDTTVSYYTAPRVEEVDFEDEDEEEW